MYSTRPNLLLLVLFLAAAIPLACAQEASQGQEAQEQETPASLTAEQQIEAAVKAAPEDMREDATVLGYEDGELTALREGDGLLICLADEPGDERFHVACYHRSLEPFMERGRELRAEGIEDVDSARRAEIEEGTLEMPDDLAALYSLTGSVEDYDPETGEIEDAQPLHVVYVPYATIEETGLPPSAETGEPWLMDPGEPWAHIMVSPSSGDDNEEEE